MHLDCEQGLSDRGCRARGGVWSRLRTTPFLIGCLIGAMLGTGVPLDASAATINTTFVAPATVAAVVGASQPDAELHLYWQNTHQSVYDTPLTAPMPTFQLNTEVTESNWLGYHKGFNEHGNKFGVELVFYYNWEKELKDLPAAQYADIELVGMISADVIGVFHGSEGSETPFHGVYLSFLAEGGQRVNHLVPMGSVPAATISAIAEANAFNATTPPTGMTPRQLCQFLARGRYKDCMNTAASALIDCRKGALTQYVATVAACTATALIPVIGWGVAAACVATALTLYYQQMDSCASAHTLATTACQTTLTSELAQCIANHPASP